MARMYEQAARLTGMCVVAAVLMASPTSSSAVEGSSGVLGYNLAVEGERTTGGTGASAIDRCRRMAQRIAPLWRDHSPGTETTFMALEGDDVDYNGVVPVGTVLCDFTWSVYVDTNHGVVISATKPNGASHRGTHVETNDGVFIGSRVSEDTDLNFGTFYGRGGADFSLNSGRFVGGPGNDVATNTGVFKGGAGDDEVWDENVGTFVGGSGDDRVYVNRAEAKVFGGPGRDYVGDNLEGARFFGGADDDTTGHNDGFFHGGSGIDAVTFTSTGTCAAVEVGCS